MPTKRKADALDVREACVAAAHAVIAEEGVERLSLRDVARRIGVSHQAPYKHYASRDHLLAEVVARAFERFIGHLEARKRSADARRDLEALGAAYLDYALRNPLEYRLMFGTPWPEAAHGRLGELARRSFDILREVLARRSPRHAAQRVDMDAMLVWSTMHGLASVLQGDVMQRLELPKATTTAAATHILRGMRAALGA